MTRFQLRKLVNRLALAATAVATLVGLAAIGAILWTLLSRGLQGVTPDLLTRMTAAPGSRGGLLNAVVGSLVMTGLGVALGTPIGVLAGTWLAEYGRRHPLSVVIRFINDVLLSAPSIIVGLFVYTALVATRGHFSALAGAVALGVIVLPVVVRSTEDMLRIVPETLREASAGLGAQPWRTIVHVIYPAARGGLLTGALLAVARVAGETAPLLFTALNNQFWSLNIDRPMASLPAVIFQYAMSPYRDWQSLAWSGALLITVFVLLLSIAARVTVAQLERRSRSGR